ncbi:MULTISPECIES: M20/M25/M40 family metallo-hydrolase [Rhizobium]|uniref:M20/M25/M40 family metallo-hydrolase n=1 Tax=Rhizobium tropici TaxID=398 RepID=A0A6P1CFE5_RHITR|nr:MULTISPECIES: M20/M25/M40 family metallo-hydrolase [Rhizobium]AGB75478.1 allantoate amidohydrolase [Rhizobium tropici CIAT 899]MBB4241850.1 N-carbamoyl-L-amino-acid hydrolase [Rhizobium tropici]MBB5593503.1 N-carbamoyl-L-amino-acid hydrolase [Rhizobium tropici]MBB6492175.1 N-carbamoyl-L-amino-acid hydrolase [Rhizobium tropici]NEV13544.1 M20/M25/M40 family metallo-hydrolase [Rhizobium tropici]
MTDFAESRFTFCAEGPIVGGKLAFWTLEMASGASHDAAFIATFAPSAMIFVACRDGRGHTPDERAEPDAIAAGASAMLEAITRLDKTLDIHSPTGLSI